MDESEKIEIAMADEMHTVHTMIHHIGLDIKKIKEILEIANKRLYNLENDN